MFVWGHVLMHVLTTVNVSLGWSTFIVVRLLARPFWGLAGKADAPPMCLLKILAWSASFHYCLCLKAVSQHLGYGTVASNHVNLYDELLALVLGRYGATHAEVNSTE